MKKLLLTFAVLLTTCLGALAQGTELWNPSAASLASTWFADTGWTPETSSTAEYNAGLLTVNIAVDKVNQWQGQVLLASGVTYNAAKQYDFTFKFSANKNVNGITLKIDDNTGIVYEDQSINITTGETLTYSKKNVTGAPGNGKIVFDFGHATAGTTITVTDISIIEHDPIVDPTKPSATASSGNAAFAVDGDNSTRWESATTDNEWFQVDYKEAKSFNFVQILWEGAYGKSFKLLGSNDGTTWTDLKEITDQTIGGPFPYTQNIDLGSVVTYQYVKFEGISRGTPYGYSFWEFSVFEKEASVLTTLSVTPSSGVAKVGIGLPLNINTLDQYNSPMPVNIDYSVTPSGAATIVDGVLTASQTGPIHVVATSGTLTSEFNVFVYAGDNLALSTDIVNDNKIIAQSDFTPSGTDAFHAVDADEGSVYQGCPTNGTAADETSRTYDSWFVIDLGKTVNVELITIKFEGACSQDYHVDFSAAYDGDATAWTTGYNYVGNAGVNGHTDMLYPGGTMNLTNTDGVRYVRFYSTKAATEWGMKMFDMKVYGVEASQPTVDVTVDSAVKYATLYSDKELTTANDVKIYTGVISGDKLMLTELGSKTIPANTAVMVNASCSFAQTSTGATFTGQNDLKGVLVDTDASTLGAYGILVLGNVDGITGFYTYTGTTLGANKAYIEKTANMSKALTVVVEGEETDGINTVNAASTEGIIYNLNGVRVNKSDLQKGVYIVNGNKYVVK